ncbi:MAG TPA: hypothetical protein VGC45_15070 [Gryllotalpicola sp.]
MADGNLLGGGVVVALAATLWLVYLIPTWLRRREYMATERNAVRLQQTLRILAEAAEVPEEIHVEATARDVAETQKALRKVQQRAVAEAKERAAAAARVEAQLLAEKQAAVEAEARAAEQASAQARAWAAAEARVRIAATRERVEAAERKARAAGAVLPANVARGIRRGRILASCVLLAGVVLFVVGAVAGWMLLPLVLGGVLVLGALAGLARLAKRVADARRGARSQLHDRTRVGELYDHAEFEPAAPSVADVEVPAAQPWTPRPLPRPLHLSRGTMAASTMASLAAAAELRRAANRAELEERAERIAAQRTPVVAKLVPAKAAPTPAPQAPSAESTVTAAEERLASVAPAREQATLGEGRATGHRPVDAERSPQASGIADSRYARMGIVGEQDDAPVLNLDEVLARRRAV